MKLSGTYSSAALLALIAAGPAFAADGNPAPAAGPNSQEHAQPETTFEDVVVTARRVEEDVQRVPISVTVLTAKKTRTDGHQGPLQRDEGHPGLTMFGSPGSAGNLTIRGLNGTVSYFADVPHSLSGFSSLFDIQNFETLKGPQGTLFGLASNAGALVVVPQKPGKEFGGFVRGAVGDFSRRSLEGALDIPVVEDRVLLRLAAQSYFRKGWITDITNGSDIRGRRDYYILRPSLIVKPTDKIENYTIFEYFKSNVSVLGNNGFGNPPQIRIRLQLLADLPEAHPRSASDPQRGHARGL